MADEAHIKLLRQGAEAWNAWRGANPHLRVDLSGADLREAKLSFFDLSKADLRMADLSRAGLPYSKLNGADLVRANLTHAYLFKAVLTGADLRDAQLGTVNLSWASLNAAQLNGAELQASILARASFWDANLTGANLAQADLRGASLDRAILADADLSGANLSGATIGAAHLNGTRLYETLFADVDLSKVHGLAECVYRGPSIIDFRTLQRSKNLPLSFLRGCGLPDVLIDYLPSLVNRPIQFHSCFISYSTQDEAFVQRLHADLQDAGVRCWFAPEDMKIGDKIRTRIDEAIRVHDKLLLVLSVHSVASEWVEKEVEAAFEQERRRKEAVLFPIRLDDIVMKSETGWASDIKLSRHIGDFRDWMNSDSYEKGWKRLLRDLQPTDT